MPQGEIKTRIARVFIDDDGIIQKIFLPQAEESLEDAVEVWEAVKKLSNGVPRPMLVDFTELRKMDSKARSYYAEQDT